MTPSQTTDVAYHRPASIDEALELLAPGDAVPLAGGTLVLAAATPPTTSVVDLQSLDLDGIDVDDLRISMGAMTRLDAIARHDAVPTFVRDMARAELPSTLRTLATVGGTVAAGDPDSPLLGALLVFDAVVRLSGGATYPLASVLEHGVAPGRLVEAVEFEPTGTACRHVVGRTPGDAPIVGVYGRVVDGAVRLAATGVAPHPIVLHTDELASLSPPADFRGSSRYRKHLLTILTGRVLAELAP